MLAPDPHGADKMMVEVNDRLRSALAYLLSDVIGEPRSPEQVSATPAAHALQNLMREAAVAGDVAEIKRLHAEHHSVLSRPEATGALQILSWGAGQLTPSEWFLLQSAFGDDVGLTTQLIAPAPAEFERVCETVATLDEILAQDVADWWGEVQALVSMVVLAQGSGDTVQFGGASAFASWGAVLVNPLSSPTPLSLALALVHECSHQKLFYAFLDDEIVLNDPEARYTSPLRKTERPMNGIYHATYVLARMTVFLHKLAQSPAWMERFGAEAEAEILEQMATNASVFEDSHAIVAAHGELTAKGAAIMAECATAVGECRGGEQAA